MAFMNSPAFDTVLEMYSDSLRVVVLKVLDHRFLDTSYTYDLHPATGPLIEVFCSFLFFFSFFLLLHLRRQRDDEEDCAAPEASECCS